MGVKYFGSGAWPLAHDDSHSSPRLGAATLAFSGCHEMFHFGPGEDPNDYPVGGHDIGASPGTAGASAGTRFTGRADGAARFADQVHAPSREEQDQQRPLHRELHELAGELPTRERAVARQVQGSPQPQDRQVQVQGAGARDLRRRDRRQGVPSPGLQGKAAPEPPSQEAGPRRLHDAGRRGRALRRSTGTAIVRVKLTQANKMRFRGRVTQRQGAERGFTPACTKLERKFGLTPLPD